MQSAEKEKGKSREPSIKADDLPVDLGGFRLTGFSLTATDSWPFELVPVSIISPSMGLLQTVTLALAAASGLVAADGLNARAQKIGKVRMNM